MDDNLLLWRSKNFIHAMNLRNLLQHRGLYTSRSTSFRFQTLPISKVNSGATILSQFAPTVPKPQIGALTDRYLSDPPNSTTSPSKSQIYFVRSMPMKQARIEQRLMKDPYSFRYVCASKAVHGSISTATLEVYSFPDSSNHSTRAEFLQQTQFS